MAGWNRCAAGTAFWRCYNTLIPSLMPELPAHQKEALAYAAKVPMMYTNVLVRKWTAFARLGVSAIQAPVPLSHDHEPRSRDDCRRLSRRHDARGANRGAHGQEPEQTRFATPRAEPAGQKELLATTFEQFELEIRRQLGRMLGGGGFDPASDIVGITVNRWPYGYAYTYDSLADPDGPPEQRPHVIGRQRFGRVAIANSDAGAAAFTNQAIDEANRAVEELFVADGLT